MKTFKVQRQEIIVAVDSNFEKKNLDVKVKKQKKWGFNCVYLKIFQIFSRTMCMMEERKENCDSDSHT